MNVKGTKKKNQVVAANIFEQQEMKAKAEAIKNNLKASTWHELETGFSTVVILLIYLKALI